MEITGRFYPEKRKRKLEAYKLQGINILKKLRSFLSEIAGKFGDSPFVGVDVI